MFNPGDLERAAGIAQEYEVENYLRHHRRRRSGAGNILLGAAVGYMLGRKTAQREDRGPDSGRTPRGCF